MCSVLSCLSQSLQWLQYRKQNRIAQFLLVFYLSDSYICYSNWSLIFFRLKQVQLYYNKNMKSTVRTLMPIKIENRLVPKQGFITTPASNNEQRLMFSSPLSTKTQEFKQAKQQSTMFSPAIKPYPDIPYKPQEIKVTIRRSDSVRSSGALSDCSQPYSQRSEYLIRPSYQNNATSYNSSVTVGLGNTHVSSPYSKMPDYQFITRAHQPLQQTGNSFSSVNLSASRSQKQSNLNVNESTNVVNSEYYTQMDSRISNGIRKLEQMDRRITAYQLKSKNNGLSNTSYSNCELKNNSYNNNGFNNTFTQLPSSVKHDQLEQIWKRNELKIKNIPTKEQQSSNRKKQQYLQQIINKTKRIKQIQSIIQNKDTRIAQLEKECQELRQNQSKHNQAIQKYESSARDYRNNVDFLTKQIKENKQEYMKKKKDHEKQINLLILSQDIKIQQIILNHREQLKQKQNLFSQQIQKIKQSEEELLKDARKTGEVQIFKLIQAHEVVIHSLKLKKQQQAEQYKVFIKKQHQRQLSLKQEQMLKVKLEILELNKKMEEKQTQLNNKSHELEQQEAIITQVDKLHEYYKSQYKKVQQKWKDDIGKRNQIEADLREQLSKMMTEIEDKATIIDRLELQIADKCSVELELNREKQERLLASELVQCQMERKIQQLQQKFAGYEKMEEELVKLKTIESDNAQKQKQLINANQKLKTQTQKYQKLQLQNKQLDSQVQKLSDQLKQTKIKHDKHIEQLQQQLDTKSKQIFSKLTDYYQQKQRLSQEIRDYKEKIQQKQKQLKEQCYKMHEVENLIKNNMKEISINNAEFEKMKSESASCMKIIEEINGHARLCYEQLMQLDESYKSTIGKTENEKDNGMVKSVLNFAVSQNKILLSKYLTAKESLKMKNVVNIPERDAEVPKHTADFEAFEKSKPTKCYNSVATWTTLETEDHNSQTFIEDNCTDKKKQLEISLQQFSIKIGQQKGKNIGSHLETEASEERLSSPLIMDLQNVDQQQYPSSPSRISTPQQLEPTTQPGSQSASKPDNTIQRSSSLNQSSLQDSPEDFQAENTALRIELGQKEQIIEVMESCIEGYKEMIKDMKKRIQNQQKIQAQYADILDFFEVDPDSANQQAHEELLDTITVFTNKLQKMITTVTTLQSELQKSTEENSSLKEKKKKMIRELKRCEQMIEKACTENEQLETKVQELTEKIDRGDELVNKLHTIIDSNCEDLLRRSAMILNLKLQIRTNQLKDEGMASAMDRKVSESEEQIKQIHSIQPKQVKAQDKTISKKVQDQFQQQSKIQEVKIVDELIEQQLSQPISQQLQQAQQQKLGEQQQQMHQTTIHQDNSQKEPIPDQIQGHQESDAKPKQSKTQCEQNKQEITNDDDNNEDQKQTKQVNQIDIKSIEDKQQAQLINDELLNIDDGAQVEAI